MNIKLAYKIIILASVTFIFISPARAIDVNVPGTLDLWLAGMPNGSSASCYFLPCDFAPAQSPVLVGISIVPGNSYAFSASGLVDHGVSPPSYNGPDGDTAALTNHWDGAQNGIANLLIPYNALIGVFLDSNQPSLSPSPASLDFSTPASRNFSTLSPLLKQPFYIGDGNDLSGARQYFTAPSGAARLFLGTMDSYGWANNLGSFSVSVLAQAPPDANMLLLVPNGGQTWVAGKKHNIEWDANDPNIGNVIIQYSANDGQSWNDIATCGNTGFYEWTIPAVDSNQCLVRIINQLNQDNYDTSNHTFTIFQCLTQITGDFNGDCYVDIYDFEIFSENWLSCGNPFDPSCQP